MDVKRGLRPLVVLLFACVLLASCRQASPNPPNANGDGQRVRPEPELPRDPDVYIGGTCSIKDYVLDRDTKISGRATPCYWKNGELVQLSVIDPHLGGYLSSLFVSGSDVYAAGQCTAAVRSYSKWTITLCYWKNGERIDLHTYDLPSQWGQATSIFVSGNDAYVSGATTRRTTFSVVNSFPCIWKNGERIELPIADGFVSGEAQSVFVAGNDVYVAGTIAKSGGKHSYSPCLWKNGVISQLSVDKLEAYNSAMAVFLSGADLIVTVLGSNGGVPCYWKNGARTDLPLQRNDYYSISWNSICLFGDDSYVAGHFEEEWALYAANDVFPCYWKNGEVVEMEREDGGEARAIAFFGDDMHIAGTANHKFPCYWRNGTKTLLPVIDSARGGNVRTILVQ